jgi:hypothetical protein
MIIPVDAQYDAQDDAPVQQCTCDRSSEFHYAITRYIAGYDEEHEFTCQRCHYTEEIEDFISIDEISNQFKEDKVHLLNIRRGPNNLGLFDMIEKMHEILDFAHDMPYLKNREHFAIMYRHQELDTIVKTLTEILNKD